MDWITFARASRRRVHGRPAQTADLHMARWAVVSRACNPVVESLENRCLFASVATDQSDYAFGSTAQITGDGFAPGETVELQVTHLPGTPGSNDDPQNAPWDVQADGDGGIATNWLVDDP